MPLPTLSRLRPLRSAPPARHEGRRPDVQQPPAPPAARPPLRRDNLSVPGRLRDAGYLLLRMSQLRAKEPHGGSRATAREPGDRAIVITGQQRQGRQQRDHGGGARAYHTRARCASTPTPARSSAGTARSTTLANAAGPGGARRASPDCSPRRPPSGARGRGAPYALTPARERDSFSRRTRVCARCARSMGGALGLGPGRRPSHHNRDDSLPARSKSAHPAPGVNTSGPRPSRAAGEGRVASLNPRRQ
ncbi:hypothetical protein EVAR_97015_1 [Eumeta japonica]|uniref:Uncharacterized protein n=1 Tax=Eumeta variegata TaxID=151549 RepID=A0A4C1WJZ1_EUMVA|nr:hypothetical protein EVAR_97015_1 [Eumeta japonica]